ncbi:hemin receptor [Elizabethkingia argentiflava]|uniref:Hemin receptor n=1 Tax=Elizabethkingia argenteiflava TaxID=2681556 RepID=A0A845Q0K0_9FLAO|nr:hemin receptor [Elizabethkingia argenteiflava]
MSLFPAVLFLHAQENTEIRNAATVYGNNMTLGTSRYLGMAGSMGAIGGDISATNVNPAGLGVYITGDFHATLGINSYKNTSTLNQNSLSYNKNNTNLSQFGGVLAFPLSGSDWKYLNIGINYLNQNLDDYIETPGDHDIYRDLQGQGIRDRVSFDGHSYNRTGHLTKTNFGVGGNYKNKLYVGLGLNFHAVDVRQWDSYRMQFASDPDDQKVFYNKQYSPYDESSVGFSMAVGAIGKLNDFFRLGLSIESPTWWDTERNYTSYSNADPKIYSDDRDFRTPAKASFSAALIPSKDFAFNIDYTLGISKPKYTSSIDQGSVNESLNQYFNSSSKNLSEFRVGAEYRVAGLRLRGGYSFANNPFDQQEIPSIHAGNKIENVNYNNLYVGKRNILGLGIGYDFRSFYVDAAYQNIRYDYDNPFFNGEYFTTDSSISSKGVNFKESIVSTVKNQQNNIFITMGYKF